MEDKTILEELLERAPDERQHKRKMDKAYHLLAEGMCGEAEALFDEMLAEEPFNRDALTGKKLIERQRAVESRMDSLTARARTALPETQTAEASAAQQVKAEPKKTAEKAPAHEPKLGLLRSKKVKAALIAVFALLVAAAAAFVITGTADSSNASFQWRTETPADTVFYWRIDAATDTVIAVSRPETLV